MEIEECSEEMKRGRPRLYTDEERVRRRKEYIKKRNASVKNISLDEKRLTMLREAKKELETDLGFEVTHKQAVEFLITYYRKNKIAKEL